MPKPSNRTPGDRGRSRRRLSPLQRLIAWVGGRGSRRKGSAASQRNRSKPTTAAQRTLADWKDLRRRTTAEAKAHLEAQQPLPAIRKLSRALLEDPQHQPYHVLLMRAVQQRRERRLKPGRRDPWLDLPEELREQAWQVEAFSAYVQELEQWLEKAGIPPLAAPPGAAETSEPPMESTTEGLTASGHSDS